MGPGDCGAAATGPWCLATFLDVCAGTSARRWEEFQHANSPELFRKLKLPKGTSLHPLRHTHASELLDMGVPLPVVSARLGHSSVRVTADVYSHAIHGQDDEAVRRWEECHQRNRPASRRRAYSNNI